MDVRERFCMNSDGQLNPFSGYGLWMNGDGLVERVPLTWMGNNRESLGKSVIATSLSSHTCTVMAEEHTQHETVS